MQVKKIGIVGFGLMGSGITQVCAQAGYPVLVSEINDELLQKGLQSLTSRLTRDVETERLSTTEKELILGRIKGTTDTADFVDCDLMIETATENLDVKKKIFAGLDSACPDHTIMATNTSAQSITEIAMATGRPEYVLGLHFFNPVPVMKLVEVIKTIAASEATVKTGIEFVTSLGKTPVVCQDNPGFIVNRLFTPMLLDAVRMVESGQATREDIDNAAVLGMNLPMGPLQLIDLIGIDSLYAGACAMYEELKDPKFAPPVLLKKMMIAGWLGRKSGKGFYEYT